MELDRHGAELLFQVLTEREEKNSVAIASNESFGGQDLHRPPALRGHRRPSHLQRHHHRDRHRHSYRLASTRARAEEAAKAG